MAEAFDDSRRLTGGNLFLSGPGAALESVRGLAFDDAAIARWRALVERARDALGWPQGEIDVRRHRSGVSLAFAAPADVLYAATEVNEWAWQSAAGDGEAPMHAPAHAATWDVDSALETLQRVAADEANPALLALRDAAAAHGVPFLPDDDEVTVGAGTGGQTWPARALPAPADVDWPALHAIPSALVTGSNGKTTTTRLIAAMLRAHGLHTAHSCTDGVFLDGVALEAGDFSGPTGARTALRERTAQAAVLETARGGLLRRGLALARADVAVVTNVSPDHFGEYGVHGLEDLARVKLSVARAIDDHGLLVLNADDALLRTLGPAWRRPTAWASLDDASPVLVAHRAAGGTTCGVADGRLRWARGDDAHDLGAVADMPLTLGGRAAYNIANITSATVAAHALGVPFDTIAATLARFGTVQGDNPGRLQHWRFGTLDVFLDYAHNPDGLQGFLHAIGADARAGRLAVLLGHAGNREDADLRAVATTVAGFAPELVVLKDIGGYERGRAAGEVASIMRGALLAGGVPEDGVELELDEVAGARRPLAWARDGDLVALPVHELAARARVVAWLDTLRARDWRPGQPLPDEDPVA